MLPAHREFRLAFPFNFALYNYHFRNKSGGLCLCCANEHAYRCLSCVPFCSCGSFPNITPMIIMFTIPIRVRPRPHSGESYVLNMMYTDDYRRRSSTEVRRFKGANGPVHAPFDIVTNRASTPVTVFLKRKVCLKIFPE